LKAKVLNALQGRLEFEVAEGVALHADSEAAKVGVLVVGEEAGRRSEPGEGGGRAGEIAARRHGASTGGWRSHPGILALQRRDGQSELTWSPQRKQGLLSCATGSKNFTSSPSPRQRAPRSPRR